MSSHRKLIALTAGVVLLAAAAVVIAAPWSGNATKGHIVHLRNVAFTAKSSPSASAASQAGVHGAENALVRAVAAWGALVAVGPGQASNVFALADPPSRSALVELAKERFAAETGPGSTARPSYLTAAVDESHASSALSSVMADSALPAGERNAFDSYQMVAHYSQAEPGAYPTAPMIAAGVSGVRITSLTVGGMSASMTARATKWEASAQVEPNGRMIVSAPSGPEDVTATATYSGGTWVVSNFATSVPAGWSP